MKRVKRVIKRPHQKTIWSETPQSKTGSKDLKFQKMQGYILETVNPLESSKGLMVHDLALPNHENSSPEQTRRYDIAYFLYNYHHTLEKNVPSESEFLFDDDFPKRIMNLTTN